LPLDQHEILAGRVVGRSGARNQKFCPALPHACSREDA
jgi:hypothetical protein